jgi:hypothetical protein
MKTFETIATIHLDHVVGGEQAAAAAPAQPDVAALEDRIRQLEDQRLEDKFRERERFSKWESRHPLKAFVCQGDRSCMR